MKRILFQGDSITDCGRNREDIANLGGGYPKFVGARLGYEFPSAYSFVNKGISGNRIVDVYARIKADIINLKPDYMSILIGVNDVWHEVAFSNGVDINKYEKIYTMLLEEILEALPNIKIMILEPFVVKGTATEDNADIPDRYSHFCKVKEYAKVARRIADKFGFSFVELQDKFDAACASNGNNAYWVRDGVHPTDFGHELIARAWLEEFEKIK